MYCHEYPHERVPTEQTVPIKATNIVHVVNVSAAIQQKPCNLFVAAVTGRDQRRRTLLVTTMSDTTHTRHVCTHYAHKRYQLL